MLPDDVSTLAGVDYGERLESAMRQAGVTRAALATHLGVTQQAIGQVIAGKTKMLDARNHTLAARLLRCDPLWLAAGIGKPGVLPKWEDEGALIRTVDIKLRAGSTGVTMSDIKEGPRVRSYPVAWFTERGWNPDDIVLAYVCGASMEPTMPEGAMVFINTAMCEAIDGAVFAIDYEGEAVIKRLVRDAGEWLLRSDSPDKRRHPDKRAHEGVRLLGQVVVVVVEKP